MLHNWRREYRDTEMVISMLSDKVPVQGGYKPIHEPPCAWEFPGQRVPCLLEIIHASEQQRRVQEKCLILLPLLVFNPVMPRFAEQVEVAIEALSANVPQPFEENEFIDASRLVYDGVRDIRKAVLMIRVCEAPGGNVGLCREISWVGEITKAPWNQPRVVISWKRLAMKRARNRNLCNNKRISK